MADTHDFPPDLVALRVELLEADEAWAAAARDKEAGPEAVTAAYRRVHDLTQRLYGHEWVREHGAGHLIRMALRNAAKDRRVPRDS